MSRREEKTQLTLDEILAEPRRKVWPCWPLWLEELTLEEILRDKSGKIGKNGHTNARRKIFDHEGSQKGTKKINSGIIKTPASKASRSLCTGVQGGYFREKMGENSP